MSEREEELGILESIYPDELEVLSEDEIVVHLALETVPPRHLRVGFVYPEGYPDEVPLVTVETDKEKDDAEPDPIDEPGALTYSFSSEDVASLVEAGRESAEENIGMPSVFSIVSQVKDIAEDLYCQRIGEMERRRLHEIEKAEAHEQAKFHGTPVTKESYAAWRAQFRQDMDLDKPREIVPKKLTGREMFERGFAKESDEGDEQEEEEQEEKVGDEYGGDRDEEE